MKRFLFVVPPFAGHVLPTVSVARTLASREHRVAWAAHADSVGRLLPRDAQIFSLDDETTSVAAKLVEARARHLRGLESLRFLWRELLIPLAQDMLPRVARAISEFEPDVVVVDHQALAGAFAARRAGVPFVTFCTTSASVVDALADLPKVKEWIDERIRELERAAGLDPSSSPDLSPLQVVVFSTEALIGSDRRWPEHYRFVGPSIQDRPDPTPFPWAELNGKPRVFASLGTINADAGAEFYAALVAAFGRRDVQVVLAAPPARVGDVPPNFIVRERVPQLDLLPRVDAVICHAGHNTVCESLANGLPLVVAPIRDDQPVVAQQVVRAGAGVRVRYGRISAASLRDAVERVLGQPTYRAAAGVIRDSFGRAGGARAAADALEGLS